MTKEIVYEKISSMILAAACCLGIAGMTSSCKTEEVTLSVWCAHDDIALTEQLIKDFKNEYSGKAVFNITISEEEELSCKETVLANPSAAADEIIAANGGKDSGAIRCVSSDGKLFAYPKTAKLNHNCIVFCKLKMNNA